MRWSISLRPAESAPRIPALTRLRPRSTRSGSLTYVHMVHGCERRTRASAASPATIRAPASREAISAARSMLAPTWRARRSSRAGIMGPVLDIGPSAHRRGIHGTHLGRLAMRGRCPCWCRTSEFVSGGHRRVRAGATRCAHVSGRYIALVRCRCSLGGLLWGPH